MHPTSLHCSNPHVHSEDPTLQPALQPRFTPGWGEGAEGREVGDERMKGGSLKQSLCTKGSKAPMGDTQRVLTAGRGHQSDLREGQGEGKPRASPPALKPHPAEEDGKDVRFQQKGPGMLLCTLQT